MLARIVSLLILLMGLCSWSTPAGAVETSQSFVAPTIKDFRLDWCRNWGVACGGPAAVIVLFIAISSCILKPDAGL